MPEIVRGEVMAEILEFRTKKLTGFIPDTAPSDMPPPQGEASNRAFWIGPEQAKTEPFEAPSDDSA